MVTVKTVYTAGTFRKPNITKWKTKKAAEEMVKAILEYRIGIASCKIVKGKNKD